MPKKGHVGIARSQGIADALRSRDRSEEISREPAPSVEAIDRLRMVNLAARGRTTQASSATPQLFPMVATGVAREGQPSLFQRRERG